MQAAISQIRLSLGYVHNLHAIHGALKVQTTDVLDLSDILRAELVMAVSALDHYVHETVRLGMLEIHHGQRSETRAFARFEISMQSVRQALTNPTDDGWLEQEIRRSHGWRSFQSPDNIRDAIRFVSEVRFWDAVAAELGMTAEDVRAQLGIIVDRRNKIAHEADVNPTVPGSRWPIDEVMVNEAVDFVERLAEAIHSVL